MSLQPGKRFGRYELVARIGYGGMAEAWQARLLGEEGFTKTVFIKKVLPEYSDDYAFTSMLISEARICATLTHSNIAQVFDFGRVENEYFLAMEYVDGRELSSVLDRALRSGWTAIPVGPAVFIGIGICRGLHHAHMRKDGSGKPLGIVHRDVSPENVIISYEGEVKIIDFGLAKAQMLRGFTTEPGVMKGKYLFFSPEQARGEEVDALTDVWATGVVLYELLCGKLPVQGPEYVVLPKLSKGLFPRPRELNPQLPPELDDILMRALALRKEERYPSCQAFGDALAEFLYATAPRISTQTISYLVQELFREDLRREGRDVQVPRSFLDELASWRGQPRPDLSQELDPPTVPVPDFPRLTEPAGAFPPSPPPARPWKWSVAGGTAFAWLVLGLTSFFFLRAPTPAPAGAPPEQAPETRTAQSAKPPEVPVDYERFIQQGRTAMDARRYVLASDNYRMALKLDPNAIEAKEGLGLSLVLGGTGKASDKEAAKLLREVVTREPANARAWFGLGMALHMLRDEDAAAEAYKYYLALEPAGRFSLDASRALKQLGED